MDNKIIKETPPEIKGWNWGAFTFSWIWGISNRLWFSLWALVPFVGLIMMFVLGARGNEWAWQRADTTDVNEFLKYQRKWNIAAAVYGLIIASIFVILFSSLFYSMYQYNMGSKKDEIFKILNSNEEIVEILGAPVEKNSFVSFNYLTKMLNNGKFATLDHIVFEAKGSQQEANVALNIMTYDGETRVVYLEIQPKDSDRIVIVDESANKIKGVSVMEVFQALISNN